MVPPVPGTGTRLGGFVCIVASAAGFGAMPIFAKLAYAESVDLPSMLFLRFALAGLMMALLMRVRGMVWPSGRNLLLLVAMGGVGYVAQSFCYFAALQYATASLTALLLYLYPAIVTVLSALLVRRRLSPLRLLAVVAALFGTGLAVGGSLAGSVPVDRVCGDRVWFALGAGLYAAGRDRRAGGDAGGLGEAGAAGA